MPSVHVTSRTGAAPPDWARMEAEARLILAQNPALPDRLTATAHLCAAAKARGRPEDAAAAAEDLRTVLARAGLSLKAAAAQFDAVPAAVAIVTAAGDLEGARAFFHKAFLRSGQPLGQIIMSDTADLAGWAERAGRPITVIEPESRVTLDAGAQGLSPPEYTAAPFVAAVVPDGEIMSGWDFARTPEGTVLGLETGEFFGVNAKPFFHIHSELTRTVVHYWPRKAVDVPEAALFLPAPFRMHPGHWIIDGLPRLAALAGHVGFKVAIRHDLPPRQRELLGLFGVKPEQIIECKYGMSYRFRELLVAQYDSSARPSPGKIRFIADRLRQPRTPDMPPRRVFVARGVPTRRAINEEEVARTLAEFGFSTVNLSIMSNDEQRNCFAAAEIVVTTYGSDLLVCYFMQPGAHLIEFNWDVSLAGPGAPACNFIGIDYHLLMCHPVEGETKVNKKDSDFRVDCAALRRLLARIIAAKS